MDREWAVGELRRFLDLTERVAYKNDPNSGVFVAGTHQRGSESEAAASVHVVEQILDRVVPGWRGLHIDRTRWKGHREWASRAIAAIERQQELDEKLGEVSPRISTGALHPWVWGPARSLWNDGHFRAAVHAAASNVNAQVQAKTNRFDISDKALFEQTLTLDPSKDGKPRLRVLPPDDSSTYRSQQEGSLRLAVGLFQVVRNSAAHSTDEIDPDEAIERIAALSLLARILDRAELEV